MFCFAPFCRLLAIQGLDCRPQPGFLGSLQGPNSGFRVQLGLTHLLPTDWFGLCKMLWDQLLPCLFKAAGCKR